MVSTILLTRSRNMSVELDSLDSQRQEFQLSRLHGVNHGVNQTPEPSSGVHSLANSKLKHFR